MSYNVEPATRGQGRLSPADVVVERLHVQNGTLALTKGRCRRRGERGCDVVFIWVGGPDARVRDAYCPCCGRHLRQTTHHAMCPAEAKDPLIASPHAGGRIRALKPEEGFTCCACEERKGESA